MGFAGDLGDLFWSGTVSISSRASFAPTGDRGCCRDCVRPPPGVGAGLLAKRVACSTLMQADPPLSRASFAPTGDRAVAEAVFGHHPVWERACSRRGWHIQY
ncbi:hypothetical protein F7R20_06115 [Pseudomonas brassicacearum subsp. brassicacearum]|nr:hypothetical protein F7R20_06115 [Pseudomonas brassicacearum subsp. brassicacearum]PJH91092.1 hypothetical protein CVG87_03540 [Pseudomonas sp. WCS365]QEO76103.1 hypothetical protein ELZ14_00485 [Pseudomonas brassicacearum]